MKVGELNVAKPFGARFPCTIVAASGQPFGIGNVTIDINGDVLLSCPDVAGGLYIIFSGVF